MEGKGQPHIGKPHLISSWPPSRRGLARAGLTLPLGSDHGKKHDLCSLAQLMHDLQYCKSNSSFPPEFTPFKH